MCETPFAHSVIYFMKGTVSSDSNYAAVTMSGSIPRQLHSMALMVSHLRDKRYSEHLQSFLDRKPFVHRLTRTGTRIHDEIIIGFNI